MSQTPKLGGHWTKTFFWLVTQTRGPSRIRQLWFKDKKSAIQQVKDWHDAAVIQHQTDKGTPFYGYTVKKVLMDTRRPLPPKEACVWCLNRATHEDYTWENVHYLEANAEEGTLNEINLKDQD